MTKLLTLGGALLASSAWASEGYYSDRRTGCRLWTPDLHDDATVQWNGGCRNGLAEGAGVLTLTHSVPNESDRDVELRIEGKYVAGKLEGQALVTYAGGARFEGNHSGGLRSGRGRFTMVGKGYYDGEYQNDTWQGYGVFVLDPQCSTCDYPGSRYEGEWVNGAKQGPGIFTKANGDKYEGMWGNNLPEGAGTYIWANGKRYVGKWASGCSLGPDNRLYSFYDNRPDICEQMRDFLRNYAR